MNMPTMEVPIPTMDELGLDRLKALLARRQSLKQEIEKSEKEIEVLDYALGKALDEKGAKNAVYEDWLVIRRKASAGRPGLDRTLLLDAGVTPQQLEAGTKFGKPGKPGITVQSISKTRSKGHTESNEDGEYSPSPV